MASHIVRWQGRSGKWYEFQVCELRGSWNDHPGLYIFSHFDGRFWRPDYIGRCHSFKSRITSAHHKWAAAIAAGATHVHAMIQRGTEFERELIERDLVAGLQPTCNETLT
jgi:hypothetical protein